MFVCGPRVCACLCVRPRAYRVLLFADVTVWCWVLYLCEYVVGLHVDCVCICVCVCVCVCVCTCGVGTNTYGYVRACVCCAQRVVMYSCFLKLEDSYWNFFFAWVCQGVWMCLQVSENIRVCL